MRLQTEDVFETEGSPWMEASSRWRNVTLGRLDVAEALEWTLGFVDVSGEALGS